MVFRLLLASILMLGQARSIAQVEQLTTAEEVAQFVHKVAPEYGSISSNFGFRLIPHASFDSLTRAYQLHSFEKVDLDGNGMTDVILNGSRYSYSQSDSFPRPLSLAVLSFGKESFDVRDLSLDHFEDIAAHPIWLDGKPYVQVIRVNQKRIGDKFHVDYHIDTLAWELSTFIEKKPRVTRKISQIDYTGWNGLAFWANMTLRITNDSVRLKKQLIEGFAGLDHGGVYLTRLDTYTSQKLYGLLDALDFVSLNDSFHIDAYDATTGVIKITYDDDQIKEIVDYGTSGTYGLAELHQLLWGLTTTQHWVNADPITPRRIDSLHTDAEVLGLVRTLDMDYPYLEFEPDAHVRALPDYRQQLTAFGQQKWQKADIDGNGYTDLLFNGYLNRDGESRQYSIVVLSFEGDSLRKQDISGANGFFAARIIRYNGSEYVQIQQLEAIEDSSQEKGYHLTAREDTLTANDGHILELPPPAMHHIEKLTVRNEIGDDSVVVMHDTIYWYRNDASPPVIPVDSAVPQKDINLYTLVDPLAVQKLLSLAAGIRFERLNPELLLPNKLIQYFGSTWFIEYDGGKQSRFTFDGLIGSYRLQAFETDLWELKHHRTDWKLVPRIQ